MSLNRLGRISNWEKGGGGGGVLPGGGGQGCGEKSRQNLPQGRVKGQDNCGGGGEKLRSWAVGVAREVEGETWGGVGKNGRGGGEPKGGGGCEGGTHKTSTGGAEPQPGQGRRKEKVKRGGINLASTSGILE